MRRVTKNVIAKIREGNEFHVVVMGVHNNGFVTQFKGCMFPELKLNPSEENITFHRFDGYSDHDDYSAYYKSHIGQAKDVDQLLENYEIENIQRLHAELKATRGKGIDAVVAPELGESKWQRCLSFARRVKEIDPAIKVMATTIQTGLGQNHFIEKKAGYPERLDWDTVIKKEAGTLVPNIDALVVGGAAEAEKSTLHELLGNKRFLSSSPAL